MFTLLVKCLNTELSLTHSICFFALGHKTTSIPVCIMCTHNYTQTYTDIHTHTHTHTCTQFLMNKVHQPNKGLVNSAVSSPFPSKKSHLLLSNHGCYTLITETIYNIQFHASFLFQPLGIWITPVSLQAPQICSTFSFSLSCLIPKI
jgi:hypothetical protein